MRKLRLTGFGAVTIGLLVASVAVMLLVDALVVPAGVVAGIVVLLLVMDGTFAKAVGAPGGTRRLEISSDEMPGPRRARFADHAAVGTSDEVRDEAWERERRRRQTLGR